MTIMQSGKNVPVLLNQYFCYNILKNIFFKMPMHFFNSEMWVNFVLETSNKLLKSYFYSKTGGKINFPNEFVKLKHEIFKHGEGVLVVVRVPLDAWIREIDCILVGLYVDGNKRLMYTSEYYSFLRNFKVCCFDEYGAHFAFKHEAETIDQFKEAIFYINDNFKG